MTTIDLSDSNVKWNVEDFFLRGFAGSQNSGREFKRQNISVVFFGEILTMMVDKKL